MNDIINTKIISIEGTDCSGKQTQTTLLTNSLTDNGFNVKRISFPNYESDSSVFVKMYLNGEFGDTANSLNAYQASMLFAIDRFITYKRVIEDLMGKCDYIILDRYIGSNLIHQGAKLLDDGPEKFYSFINYWSDFEINKLGLPEPNLTIYLYLPYEYGKIIAKDRKNKIDPSTEKKDIHESDSEYMTKAELAGVKISKWLNWKIVDCIKDNKVDTIDNISKKVKEIVYGRYL